MKLHVVMVIQFVLLISMNNAVAAVHIVIVVEQAQNAVLLAQPHGVAKLVKNAVRLQISVIRLLSALMDRLNVQKELHAAVLAVENALVAVVGRIAVNQAVELNAVSQAKNAEHQANVKATMFAQMEELIAVLNHLAAVLRVVCAVQAENAVLEEVHGVAVAVILVALPQSNARRRQS